MGRATAQLFADEGARVAAADRDEPALKQVVEEIARAGGSAAAFPVDVADPAQLVALARAVREQVGPIDILVNNAGIVLPGPIDGPDYADAWERTLAINLSAYAHLIRACLDQLTRNGEGRIVNIASTEGLGATAFNSPYTASKHGVVGLTRALAVELGARGVTVNCICPGPIHTGMTAVLPDEAKQRFARRRVPARRYGEPEEVAHMTLSLVLPTASFVNGAIIPVDGGLVVQNT
jgi:3-oxoacyl-[acyl-carrier protein] reductase